MNIHKSTLLKGVFAAGICLLSVIVAMYSYVGEQPLHSAIMAVGLVFVSVLLSGANVWLTKRLYWKRWTAYVVSGAFLVIAIAAAHNLGEFVPTLGPQLGLNVALTAAFASLLVSLMTAHFVLDCGELERDVQRRNQQYG